MKVSKLQDVIFLPVEFANIDSVNIHFFQHDIIFSSLTFAESEYAFACAIC